MALGSNRAGGRRDLTGLLVILALFVMAGLVIFHSDESGPQTVSVEERQDPSVDNTRGSGSHGLYTWVGQLGYRNQIWRRDFLSLPSDAKVVFCIAPDLPANQQTFLGQSGGGGGDDDSGDDDSDAPNRLTSAEGAAVRRWVAGGRTLILFASGLPPVPTNSKNDDGSYDHNASFGAEMNLQSQSALGNGGGRRYFAPMQPSYWTQGVNNITIHARGDSPASRFVFLTGTRSEVLFGDTVVVQNHHKHPASATYLPEAVALVTTIGKGHVVAVSDDEFGCNANLTRDGNAQFIANILQNTARRGDRVLFDEYHRNSGGAPSPSIWSALGSPVQYGIMQLGLAALVALLVLAPRLGRPEPLNRSTGHSTAEYVASLAGLYQSAHATSTALETIYRQFLREICACYALPTDTTLERMAETAARRGGVNGDDLRRLLIACEQALDTDSSGRNRAVSDQELITLVRAIERFRKELGIG